MADSRVKIRLLVNVSVEKKHGMTVGRILSARRLPVDGRRVGKSCWEVLGDAGDYVHILGQEAVEVTDG